ncbi:hypothetical protein V9T40_003516 [Parthenolecanium corni]|uniref:Uncharacterized protein n=1 Tax=Parthenolecanium corni TaxID=536013 RepID=A0AAN9TRF3_9HEMI
MESNEQEEYVQKLEQKLKELRAQRIKVDEANETLRKKLETLTAHLDTLDSKYGKNGTEIIKDGDVEETTKSESADSTTRTESKQPAENNSSESADK